MNIVPNKHYLFVCYANVARSPAAESWLRERADSLNIFIDVSSAGVAAEEYGGKRQVQQYFLDQADFIFTMESWMKSEIEYKYDLKGKKIDNLDIPNIFLPSFSDPRQCLNMDFEQAEQYMRMVDKKGPGNYIGRIAFHKVLEGRLDRILI